MMRTGLSKIGIYKMRFLNLFLLLKLTIFYHDYGHRSYGNHKPGDGKMAWQQPWGDEGWLYMSKDIATDCGLFGQGSVWYYPDVQPVDDKLEDDKDEDNNALRMSDLGGDDSEMYGAVKPSTKEQELAGDAGEELTGKLIEFEKFDINEKPDLNVVVRD